MPQEYKKTFLTNNSFTHVISETHKTILAYGLVLFIVPLLPLNQLIIGTLVNALLIRAALTLKTKKVFALTLVPSIAVFTGGVLFGSLTGHTLLMLPFIWIGNLVLMLLMRKLFLGKQIRFMTSALVAASTKTFTLFGVAILLFSQGLIPALFLTAFGIIQFITALAGALLVLFEKHVRK
jgi:hypothetical protein